MAPERNTKSEMKKVVLIVNDNELWKFLDLAILVFGFNCCSVTLFDERRITAYLRTT